jgi:hypothetical protein
MAASGLVFVVEMVEVGVVLAVEAFIKVNI